MSVSLGPIVKTINNTILTGDQDILDSSRLLGSVEALESVYSVANTSSLPEASDNTGRFIYIEDICAYRYSDGTQWTNDYDTTLVGTSGELWTWGSNSYGRLGIGLTSTARRCSPVREYCSATDWYRVCAGEGETSAAIKTSGQLWGWGRGTCGRLGDGTVTSACSPVREYCSAINWYQVSTNGGHTLAVKTDGTLWAWGSNTYGRLGTGTTTPSCSPVRERCSATDWCQTSAASYAAGAGIKTSGQLWVWGRNFCGRLGDGTTVTKCSPVREFCSATDWCGVSLGDVHSAAIKTSGEIWTWGRNNCRVLADGTLTPRCSPVQEFCSASNWCYLHSDGNNTFAIKTDGSLWGWGAVNSGKLGNGSTGATGGIGSPVREFCSATDWCQVSSGTSTGAVKTSGELWVWGCNSTFGCFTLGDGTAVDKYSPVREFCSATDWCYVSVGTNRMHAIKITKGFNEP